MQSEIKIIHISCTLDIASSTHEQQNFRIWTCRKNQWHSPTHTHTRKHSLSECVANNVHHFFCDTPTQQRNATLCHASGKRKPLGQCVPWKLLSRWGQFTYEMSRKKNETWLVDLLTYYVVGLPIRQVTVYVCGSCWDWGRLFFLVWWWSAWSYTNSLLVVLGS